MIKFFRKHNKQLLAVFTVLLMIAFVGGTALTSLMQPNPSGDVLFHAFGEPVTNGELAVVNRQTSILSGLRYPWNTPWGFQGRVQPLDERDYFLLLREAEERGLRPGLEQARIQLATQLATLDIDLNQFSLNNKVATDEIELAVANFIIVQQLWSMARGSIVPSELEIQQAVRDQYEELNAHIVEIKSSPLIEPQAEIPEEDVLAHFEKYKEQTSGGSALEFGYLIPDRVQVEYLVINTGEIALTQPITEKQAETYWRAHQKDFGPPATEDDSGEGSSELVGPELPSDPFYLTFAEAREDVVTFLAEERRLEEARGMASVIWRALREPWYNQPEDEAGFPEAPEVAKAADHYPQTLQKLQNRIPHRDAIDFGKTDLFAASEAGDVERLGSARVDTQTLTPGRRFGSSTHLVQGLVESARPDDSSVQQALAPYQTAPAPLIDQDNNLYLYRIIQVQERHAPTSIDEVQDKVVADLRAQRAFESAKTHAEAIKNSLGEGDLKTAYEAYDGLEAASKEECSSFFEANPFPKMKPEFFAGFRFPVIVSDKAGARDEDNKLLHQIQNEDFVADVFKLLESAGEQGVGVIEVPATEQIFVVQLAGIDHVAKLDYEDYKQTIQIQIAANRQSSLLEQWFSADSIRARCGYKPSS
ncbi:MAG: hypothetical protein IID34_11115 [Planctomycetes bacterium]|nr:hypothetical protein [Planctomycetota bacterium]